MIRLNYDYKLFMQDSSSVEPLEIKDDLLGYYNFYDLRRDLKSNFNFEIQETDDDFVELISKKGGILIINVDNYKIIIANKNLL